MMYVGLRIDNRHNRTTVLFAVEDKKMSEQKCWDLLKDEVERDIKYSAGDDWLVHPALVPQKSYKIIHKTEPGVRAVFQLRTVNNIV